MRKLAAVAAGLVATIILSTCLAQPVGAAKKSKDKEYGEPVEGQALLYLVRRGFIGGAVSMFVFSDESLLGVLDASCYAFSHVPPGDRLLWVSHATAQVAKRIELEANRTYYFDLGTRIQRLDDVSGPKFVEEVNAWCVPTEQEVRTAEKRVEKRHSEAVRFADEDEGFSGRKSDREARVATWGTVDLTAYTTLCVEDFALSDPKAGRRKNALLVESAPRRVADRVVEALEPGLFDQVMRQPVSEPPPGTLVLKGDLTQYKPGSRWGRAMIYGAGSSHLDFVVTLLDARSGEKLASFADVRTWGLDPHRGIEEMEQNIAYEIALYLKKCKEAS